MASTISWGSPFRNCLFIIPESGGVSIHSTTWTNSFQNPKVPFALCKLYFIKSIHYLLCSYFHQEPLEHSGYYLLKGPPLGGTGQSHYFLGIPSSGYSAQLHPHQHHMLAIQLWSNYSIEVEVVKEAIEPPFPDDEVVSPII